MQMKKIVAILSILGILAFGFLMLSGAHAEWLGPPGGGIP